MNLCCGLNNVFCPADISAPYCSIVSVLFSVNSVSHSPLSQRERERVTCRFLCVMVRERERKTWRKACGFLCVRVSERHGHRRGKRERERALGCVECLEF